MIVEAYQGYFENGRFIPEDHAVIPEKRKVIVTVLDEHVTENRAHRQMKALEEFWRDIRDCDEPLGPEFDEILSQRVNITRELDL